MPRPRTRARPAHAPAPVKTINLDFLPTLLGYNLRRAQISLWRDFARNVADGDVRPSLFSALLLANANAGIAQIEIAQQLGLDKASVVSLIDRLEDRGWVVRRRSTEDRRRQEIFLTASGEKAYRMLKREMLEHERRFLDRYTESERRQLVALLQRLYDA